MEPNPPSEPPENQSENHSPPTKAPEIQPVNHSLSPEPPENQLESQPQPPINPNSNTSSVHGHQERQRQSRTMENFRAKLMEYAQVTRMPPKQKLLIEQGFSDFFPGDLSVPNHPPYRAMIHRAIEELKQEGGSNEEAISIHIREKYNDLPWAHATLLRHHLGKLCETGDVVVTNDKCYMLNHGCLTFNPRPRPSLTPIDISIDSSTSSPSPCSSSTTSYSPSPKRRQQKRTRKRKYRKKRVRPRKKLESEEEFEDTEEEPEETEEEEFEEFKETDEDEFVSTEEEREVTQVENQVREDQNRRQTRRSGGRGMPPKKHESEEKSQFEEEQMALTAVRNQVEENQKRGRKPGRGRGRPCTKFGIETEVRPKEAQKEVIEAQNQVTEDRKMLKQGRGRGRPRGRPRRQNEIKEEFQPKSEQIEVIEAQNEVIENRIEVIEKQNKPEEEKEDLFEEQKQLKGVKLDVIEEQSQVPKQHDEVFDKQNQSEKENAVIASEILTQGEIFKDWNEQKQEIEVNEEQTQLEVQIVMEVKNKPQEQKIEGILEQNKSHEQCLRKPGRARGRPRTRFGIETKVRPKEAQKEVIEAQNQVTEDRKMLKQGRGCGRPRGGRHRQNEIKEEFHPSEQIEVIEAQNQVIKNKIEVIEKQNHPAQEKEDSFEEQKQLKGVKLDVIEEQSQDVIEEQSQVPKQLDEVFDKQNQSEKENAVITSDPLTQGEVFEDLNEQKKQEIGVNEEQTQPEVQNDVMEGKNKPQEQKIEGILEQNKSHDQRMVIADLGPQQEQLEDKEEVIERQHNVLMIRSEAQVQVGVIEELNGIQKQLKGACVEPNSSEQQNDVIREMNPSQGEHVEVIKDQSQPGQIKCGEIVEQDQRLEQEIEVAGGQGQHVEQEYGLIKEKNPLEEVSNMVERMVLQSCDDGENILDKVSPILLCKSPRLVTEEETKKSMKKEKEQPIKSSLEEGEFFDTSDWTENPERSPELKKMEKLSWIPDQLPQQGTEGESNPLQFHFQTPRPEADTDITMKEMVPSQILIEQQLECVGERALPKLELVTTTAESLSLENYQHGDGPDGPQQSKMLGGERLPETASSTELFQSEYQHISHQQQLEQPKHQGCGKPCRPTP